MRNFDRYPILPYRLHHIHAHQSTWWRPFTIFHGKWNIFSMEMIFFPWKFLSVPWQGMIFPWKKMPWQWMAFPWNYFSNCHGKWMISMEMQNRISPDLMLCFSMELHWVQWMCMEKSGQYSMDNISMEMHGNPWHFHALHGHLRHGQCCHKVWMDSNENCGRKSTLKIIAAYGPA